jgi:hypothetical protein
MALYKIISAAAAITATITHAFVQLAPTAGEGYRTIMIDKRGIE